MGRPALSSEHVQAWREHACEVVLELMSTSGKPDLSLRRLGEALGCSHATPYRYFKNRDELFMEVRALCFRRFGRFLRARVEGHQVPTLRLLAITQAYAEYAERQPVEFQLMFELGQPKPEEFPRAYEVGVAAWSIAEEMVQEAIKAGELRGNARTIAHELWAAVHGVVTLNAAGRLTVGRSAEQLITSITESLLRAHATHPTNA